MLTTVSILFSATSDAQTATWTKLCQLGTSGHVTAAYFFNASTGVIGFDGTGYSSPILRTTDGGVTWLTTTTPSVSGPTWITDIWFMNDHVGWATMIYTITTASYLWETTDAGQNWFPTGFPTKNPSGVRAAKHTLCVAQYSGAGIQVSTDWGMTFSTSYGTDKDHLDFVDSLHGAASGFRDQFSYTSDGGLTWQQSPTSIINECWGIYGIPGSSVFVAAHEAPGGGIATIFRSKDYGMDWVQIVNAPDPLTGGIGGNGKFLYIQTLNNGFYTSADSGTNWSPIGGPSNEYDTRFAVIDCAIYAFDNSGGVYEATNVNGIHSLCGIKQLDLAASPCSETRSTEYLNNTLIDSIDIIDLSLIDSTVAPSIAGSLAIDSMPKLVNTIPPGRSMGYVLRWAPSSLRDTGLYGAYLRLIYRDHKTQKIDTTTIPVSLTGLPARIQLSTPKRFATPNVISCKGIDTALLFRNRSCDTLTITSTWLATDKEWKISDTSGLGLMFPIVLPPDSALQIPLRYLPSTAGTSTDTLHVSASFLGADTIHKIPLIGSSKMAMPFAQPNQLQFDSIATCSNEDTVLQIKNLGCGTMTITNLYSLSKDWIITDTLGNPLSLPITVPPDSAANIRIRFKPQSFGHENSRITIQYHYYGVDSLTTFSVSGTGKMPGELTYSRMLDFGQVSFCSNLDTVLTFYNGSCQPDRIDTIMVSSPFYILDSTSFPIIVDEGKTVRVRVRYSPSHKGSDSFTATLKMMMNGLLLFDTLDLSGLATAGLSSFSTTLTQDSILFKPRSECDLLDSVIFFINNPGCDSLTINSLKLEGNTTPALELGEGTSLPIKIQGSDSIRVAISIEKLVPGDYQGLLRASYTLADGTSKDTLIPVSAVITAGTRTLAIDTSGVNLGSGTICVVHDTVLHYTNTGCLPVTILGWRMTHWDGFMVTGSGKYPPITLQPNESDSIYILYSGTAPGSYYDTVFFSCGTDKNSGRSIPVSVIIHPVDSLNFELNAPATVKAGQSFTTEIRPAKSVVTQDLQRIAGMLSYPDNNFTFESLTSAPPLQLNYQGPFVTAHIAHIPFTLTSSSPIDFDTLSPVLTLTREAMITDTIDYSVSLDSIEFNNDTNYSRCTLAAGVVMARSSLDAACPDPLIINSLSGHLLFFASPVKPNPVTSDAQYHTEVALQASENGIATIVLSDAVGRVVYEANRSLQKNTVAEEVFDLTHEPAGCYFYSIRFNSSMGSASNSGTLILKK